MENIIVASSTVSEAAIQRQIITLAMVCVFELIIAKAFCEKCCAK